MNNSADSVDKAHHGPLSGVLVIDLARALAGPHAAMMLGDVGAEVIKVENPEGGDDTRGWGPPFVSTPEGGRESTYFMSANRNKKSITLDLKTDSGKSALHALLARADVLVENFRSGVLDRLGFTIEKLTEINPRLITLSITGFGHDGPEGGRPGYDQIAQGEAGLMSVTGSSDNDLQRVGVPIADLLAGLHGAFGVVAALQERERTGVGQTVRTSLLASVVGAHAFHGTNWTIAGQVGSARGNHHPSICPYGLFETKEGAIQIAIGSERLWQRFCLEFGLDPRGPGLSSNFERSSHADQVIHMIESIFSQHTSDELLTRLDSIGVPAGRIRSIREVYEWDQTRSQGLLLNLRHPTLGNITVPGPPIRFFDNTGADVSFRGHAAPPLLGADNSLIESFRYDE